MEGFPDVSRWHPLKIVGLWMVALSGLALMSYFDVFPTDKLLVYSIIFVSVAFALVLIQRVWKG